MLGRRPIAGEPVERRWRRRSRHPRRPGGGSRKPQEQSAGCLFGGWGGCALFHHNATFFLNFLLFAPRVDFFFHFSRGNGNENSQLM